MKNLILLAAIAVLASSCWKNEVTPDATCSIAGMEGENCNIETRDKLVGLWASSDTTAGKQIEFYGSIGKAGPVTDILIFDFAGYDSTMVQARLDGDLITIDNQRLNDTTIVSGSGKVFKRGDSLLTIEWAYTITTNAMPIIGVGTWVEH